MLNAAYIAVIILGTIGLGKNSNINNRPCQGTFNTQQK